MIMKKIICIFLLLMAVSTASQAADNIVTGKISNGFNLIDAEFTIIDGKAWLGSGRNAAISQYTKGQVAVSGEITASDGNVYPVAGVSDVAFRLCSKITSVTLPEGVTRIGNFAFKGCRNLTVVVLPSTLESIGSGAFIDLPKLTDVKVYATTPPVWEYNDVFFFHEGGIGDTQTKSIGNINLYVPDESVDTYKASLFSNESLGWTTPDGWGAFSNIASVETYEPSSGSGDYDYVNHSVSGEGVNTQVTATVETRKRSECTAITSSTTELTDGWYVLRNDVSCTDVISVTGDAHLILCDDVTLSATKGISIADGKTLTVYGQADNSGSINATVNDNYTPAIGCRSGNDRSRLVIHGGTIMANNGGDSPQTTDEERPNCGIGVWKLTIFDGNVTANGGYGGAGITNSSSDMTRNNEGFVHIYGGSVTANGGKYAPGICCSDYAGGPLSIYGGTVTAKGGDYGAGIGGHKDEHQDLAVYIYDGTVTANGGTDAAGIGGGESGYGGTVYIYGGTVYANGKDYGAGIGGGEDGCGGNVYITGGTVYAKAGKQEGTGYRAIGSGNSTFGDGPDNYGYLSIGDGMTVWAGTETTYSSQHFDKDRRIAICHNSYFAKIAVCKHDDPNYPPTISITDGLTHSVGCLFCNVTTESHIFGNYLECTACHLVSLADEDSNADVISHWKNTEKSFVLTNRTLYKDGNWNTLCLPFAVTDFAGTPLEGATVKTLESATFDNTTGTLTLNFSEVSPQGGTEGGLIEAGKPYIVKWGSTESTETTENTEIVNPVFNGVTISSTTPTDVEGEAANFHGIYSPYSTGGEDRTMLYMGDDNKVYYPNTNMTINAFRAYFKLADGLVCGEPQTAGAKGISQFVLNFGEEATGITTTNYTNFTNEADAWFTLDGRRLSGKPSRAGVYINNGVKVVIK